MKTTEMSFEQLIEKLTEIEEAKFKVKETSFGHDLIFETSPEIGDFVSFSNIEMLCEWAKSNGKSISMLLGRFTKEANLTIHITDLY